MAEIKPIALNSSRWGVFNRKARDLLNIQPDRDEFGVDPVVQFKIEAYRATAQYVEPMTSNTI